MRPIFQTFYMRIVLTDITHLRKEELFGSDQFDGIHLRGPVGADVYTNMVYDSVQKSAQKYNPKHLQAKICHFETFKQMKN